MPIELLIVVIGLLEVVNGFGLWTRKLYSYWLSLIIPFFAVGVNLALIGLYAFAPSEQNLKFGFAPAFVNVIGWVIWLFIWRWYLGKPYVRTYLGR